MILAIDEKTFVNLDYVTDVRDRPDGEEDVFKVYLVHGMWYKVPYALMDIETFINTWRLNHGKTKR